MDDNKILCLMNGERIHLHPDSKICFETEHLRCVSPATVSRNGIVFFDPTSIGHKPIFEKWCNEKRSYFGDPTFNRLQQLFTDLIEPML